MRVSADSPPRLSVIVTVVSGTLAVRRTLMALGADQPVPWLEILVPVEAARADVRALAAEYPGVAFPESPAVEGGVDDPVAGHARFDRRRAAGLTAASGDIVAILEDHGTPAPGWAEAVVRAHDATGAAAAIGGVVTNGLAGAVRDALWLVDFHWFAPPRAAGATTRLTDVNVSYRRAALDDVADAWRERFQEPVVHAALAAHGHGLWLDPALVVTQERPALPFAALLRERAGWGRVFGRIVGARWPAARRAVRGAISLLLPPLLLLRILRSAGGRVPAGRLLAALPAIVALLVAWCWGEARGIWETPAKPPVVPG